MKESGMQMTDTALGSSINASRRTFLKASSIVSGGLVVGFVLPGMKRLAQAEEQAPEKKPAPLPAPNAFIHIAADNSITVLLAHSEMGQGIWTTLPMLIAEELNVALSQVKVEHAPAAPVYAHTLYGLQMTGGSSTTWSEFDRYRQAGALTRMLLINAAAQRFDAQPAECVAQNGLIRCGGQEATYGQLAEAAAKLPTPTQVTLKDPVSWTIIGKDTKRLDTPEKINGQAVFGMDIQFPGLYTALIARPPVFGGKVRSFDAAASKRVKGVRKVVQVPSGVAVIADNYWAAKQGREVLKIYWDLGKDPGFNSVAQLQNYRELAKTTGTVAAQAGDVKAAAPTVKTRLQAEYQLPYLSHAAMEPLNCAVRLTKDMCEIWTGTQMQGGDQMAASKITGLKPEQIKIHTPFLGGGFGRRATPTSDFVVEAVHVAKISGLPVKTVWTREDDIKGGYYRPMVLHTAEIGLDAQGWPLTWQHHVVGQSIFSGTPFEAMMKDGIDPTSVEGVNDSPYVTGTPNHRVDLHTTKLEVPVLWWRSVGHSHSSFVMESLIDEMAHAAGIDPLAYRRTLLKDHPRHLKTLNLVAEKAGWSQPLPAGQFRGLAVHESFGSYVAQVMEISINENSQVKVLRVVCAIDCGIAVNPEAVRAQIEGGVAFGLGAALESAISFKDGQVQQSNFHDYKVLRMNAMPRVEVHIVPSTDKMGGVGEPGLPPVAPALGNAIFAATGKRIRTLPLGDQLKDLVDQSKGKV